MKRDWKVNPKDPLQAGAADMNRGERIDGAPTRFSEEERRRLADFFILLDRLDRTKSRGKRKAA